MRVRDGGRGRVGEKRQRDRGGGGGETERERGEGERQREREGGRHGEIDRLTIRKIDRET